ncbi:selenoprotein S [Ambystoma mexicanum]|uniref:selenoprotein S n=1 Tax=Ambystoma mexicanum TaxID=8296 RepID=UPI0037E87FD9
MELGGQPQAEPLPQRPVVEEEGFSLLQETVGSLLSDYGWYILFACIAVYLLIQRQSGRIRQMLSSSTVAKDPSVVVQQHEAVAAARLRMQEELNAKAEIFKARQKELEEEKRRQKLEMWESVQQGKSFKGSTRRSQLEAVPSTSVASTVPKPKSDKKQLRGSGYNPLTGDGGGACAWRPGRRGPATGGG